MNAKRNASNHERKPTISSTFLHSLHSVTRNLGHCSWCIRGYTHLQKIALSFWDIKSLLTYFKRSSTLMFIVGKKANDPIYGEFKARDLEVRSKFPSHLQEEKLPSQKPAARSSQIIATTLQGGISGPNTPPMCFESTQIPDAGCANQQSAILLLNNRSAEIVSTRLNGNAAVYLSKLWLRESCFLSKQLEYFCCPLKLSMNSIILLEISLRKPAGTLEFCGSIAGDGSM